MGISQRLKRKMKGLLIALLLSISTIVFSQSYCQSPYQKKDKIEGWKTIALFTGSIVLEAVGDGLNDDGKKVMGHTCKALSVGTLLSTPFILNVDKKKWGWYLVSYISLRVALFDASYNKTRGLPINYVGNSSLTDKFYQKTSDPDLFIKSVFLIVGVSIPINELGYKTKR